MNSRHIELLTNTSRTFLMPILQAPPRLGDAVGAAYLCMRAIDEVEDHPQLPPDTKVHLLKEIAAILRRSSPRIDREALDALYQPHAGALPDVTMELADVAEAAPESTQRWVWDATADMADEMADWVASNWRIRNEEDLDAYTFTVAGRVGLLLSELWSWYDGTTCDRDESIGFGRALQAVNIVRNVGEDRERGVDFFPPGWERTDMIDYARRQIEWADRYMARLEPGAVYDFCIIPLSLAKATLDAIVNGKEKLTRGEVEKLVASLAGQ